MDDFSFVIITGLSGAGKTTMMQRLEDMGYYCVDNLPAVLISRFADLCWQSKSNLQHIAVVTDIRSGAFIDALPQALVELDNRGIPHEVLFIEASDEALVRRFMAARRVHPLSNGNRIQDGIAKERTILAPIRAQADMIIDTTDMKPDNLNELIRSRFGIGEKNQEMVITIFSFGFKYGIPIDADMVFDVRFLPNPFYVQKYKYWTGRVKEVGDYIRKSPVTDEFLNHLYDFTDFIVEQFEKSGKTQLTMAIGCTGGMHRSVFVTEQLGKHLAAHHGRVNVEHRDLHRNRVDHDAEGEDL
jgi:UPF0042 nucleotide-binding protein